MAKTSRMRTLMVALGATDVSAQLLVRKALQLADRFDANLRLLHIVAPSYAFVPDELKLESRALHNLVEKRNRRIDVDVATTVVRDYPVADAIVRQVLKYKPDMLLAESHRHSNCPARSWVRPTGS